MAGSGYPCASPAPSARWLVTHSVRFYDTVHIAYIPPDGLRVPGGGATSRVGVDPTGRRRA